MCGYLTPVDVTDADSPEKERLGFRGVPLGEGVKISKRSTGDISATWCCKPRGVRQDSGPSCAGLGSGLGSRWGVADAFRPLSVPAPLSNASVSWLFGRRSLEIRCNEASPTCRPPSR